VHRLYRAYWVEDRDISDSAVLEDLVGVETVEKTGNPEIKKTLIEATDEAGNPAEDADNGARRVGVIVNGLRKLGDMLAVEDADGQLLNDCVSFACGHDHDALVGLLLQRAPNVRALVREQEAAAARGVLAAPSAQR
ncbi:MAG: hypothetical protein QGG05_05825, partial [Candidatus Latescibacteria bacterium]|nr:hypothetical protein [Candidatus Latescibacterota bacterium]